VLWLAETNTVHRALWFEPNVGAYLIDIENIKALPVLFRVDALDELRSGGLLEARGDPYGGPPIEDSLSAKSREKREVRWDIIKTLVEQTPDIFLSHLRGPLVADRARETGSVCRDIYRDLRRFWQRGMTEQAVTPDYGNCGSPGKRKVASTKPLGRRGHDSTFIVTPDAEALFQRVSKETYERDKRFTMVAAHKKLILDHFSHHVPNMVGGTEVEAIDPHPSLKQFAAALLRLHDPYFLMIRRKGRASVEKDNRAHLGSSISQTLGPGSRFEIDATIANFRLRSRTSRRTIGRPVVYFVVDVFSRLIVGIYVGLEWASWAGAMQALANVVCNKVEFCRRYDIHITEDQWPGGFLPEIILGDGGEVAGPKINLLATRFNVTCETAEPGRGDLKGIIEKRFDLVPVKIEPFVGGWVDPEAKGPLPRHKRDGEFDLDGLTKALIRSTIYSNTKHVLADFRDRPVDMIADGIPAIPLEMFKWGIKNRSGRLRHFDYEDVRLSLLRTVEGKVTEAGFEVLGLYYSCDIKWRGRIFEKARQTGIWKQTFSVDDVLVDEVYWHADGIRGELIPCQLTPAYAQYAGLTRYEVDALAAKSKQIELAHRRTDLNGELTLLHELEEIHEEQRQLAVKLPSMTLAEREKNARNNRKEERNREDRRKRTEKSESTDTKSSRSRAANYALPAISKLRRKD
jgi:hypothetical protein